MLIAYLIFMACFWLLAIIGSFDRKDNYGLFFLVMLVLTLSLLARYA